MIWERLSGEEESIYLVGDLGLLAFGGFLQIDDLSLLYHAATSQGGGPTAKQFHVHTVDGAILYSKVVAKRWNPAPFVD